MVVLHLDTLSEPSTEYKKMTARAMLVCRPNSHPFQDRSLQLEVPVKVGRSVARARPSPTNCIFDCKVLSRNHALLWYENGKFFLQDTKSSNGTFVNNQRLSKGSEESPPREVCSGDIVQFGVDVMENSRKGKVTHGCIVATLKIYLPDGKEAKASPSTAVLPPLPASGTIPTQDLYQLAHYLQEALHREQMLENKLATLQNLVGNSQESSESGWKVLIDEDRLLTRLEILENQLQTYSKNFPEDKLREEVAKLQEDKNTYQSTAKESLQKVLHEKLEAVRKLQDVERSLTDAEGECSHVQEMYENLQRDLQEVAEKCSVQMQEIQELTEKLQDAEEKNAEATKALEEEKAALEAKLEEVTNEESVLKSKIEALLLENKSAKEKQILRKDCDDSLHIERIESDTLISEKDPLKENDEVQKLQCKLEDSEKQLQETKAKVESLQELIQHLEEELKRMQSENSASLIINKNEQNQVNGSPPFNQNHIGEPQVNVTNSLKLEMEKLKELLTETRDSKTQVEAELTRYKGELEEARTLADSNAQEASTLRQRIQGAQEQTENKDDLVATLQEQLLKIEASGVQQIAIMKDKLAEEQKRANAKEEEAANLRQQLLEANQSWKQSHNEAEHLKQKLKTLTEEMERKNTRSGRASSPHPAMLDNKSAEDYVQVKEECSTLKNRIHGVEAEMRKTRNENSKLQSDYKKLQDSYHELDVVKKRLETTVIPDDARETSNSNTSTDEATNDDLVEAESEVLRLKLQFTQCNDEKVKLKERLENLSEEYQLLSYQTRTISACSILPLILLALSVVLAFYPTLASITATTESPHPP